MSRYDFVNKTDSFKVVGLDAQMKQLDALLTKDPDMEKAVKGIIRDALKIVRRKLSGGASAGLRMKNDPRQAYKAIKMAVYRRILGGNVSILQKRKAGAKHDMWLPSGHVGRGGNRRKRSQRTIDLQSYYGEDRGFILRFLNQGTQERAIKMQETTIGSNGKRKTRWVSRPKEYGNRGSISARDWFGSASLSELQGVVEYIESEIDLLIEERLKKE
ncbi:MAG: hypothetical protein IJ066_11730 [Bacteroidaceae bacterium]|nr:hypothetical protein [Bacteroidaceae bacterium]